MDDRVKKLEDKIEVLASVVDAVVEYIYDLKSARADEDWDAVDAAISRIEDETAALAKAVPGKQYDDEVEEEVVAKEDAPEVVDQPDFKDYPETPNSYGETEPSSEE